jgi:hypothetical protein
MRIPDLESASARWPGFVSAAVAAGARAIFVFALQAGAIRVGVLSLYRALPGSLTPEELAGALVFADIALAMVLDAAAGIGGSPEYRLLGGPVGQSRRGVPGDRDDLGAAGRERGRSI